MGTLAVVAGVVFGMGAAIGTLVWAEHALPLDRKPSVILRASTGDLPTRNLAELAAETEAVSVRNAAGNRQLEKDIEQYRQHLAKGVGQLEALQARIDQKATEYSLAR